MVKKNTNNMSQKPKKTTMTQISISEMEELRKSELRYWQKLHPDAKVEYDKKSNEIIIKYPLPKDYEIISKFIKSL